MVNVSWHPNRATCAVSVGRSVYLVDGATVHCTYTYSAGNPGNLRSGFGGGFGSRRSNHLLFAMMFGGGGGGGMSDY